MVRSLQIQAVKRYILFMALSFAVLQASAQSLIYQVVPEVYQEQDQWCWAGTTQAVISHYGKYVSQCSIAEYVRTVATWHSYGSTNCCVSGSGGCNYWNYNWGYTGSIQDILVHF